MVELLEFDVLGDSRGSLIALEQCKEVPFEIKRVYYIFDTKEGVKRGYHAHKDLEQVLVCLSGSCRVKVDNGKESEYIVLDDCTKGIYIKSLIWREIDKFEKGTVLMVLASELYKEDDYLRDYQAFVESIID